MVKNMIKHVLMTKQRNISYHGGVLWPFCYNARFTGPPASILPHESINQLPRLVMKPKFHPDMWLGTPIILQLAIHGSIGLFIWFASCIHLQQHSVIVQHFACSLPRTNMKIPFYISSAMGFKSPKLWGSPFICGLFLDPQGAVPPQGPAHKTFEAEHLHEHDETSRYGWMTCTPGCCLASAWCSAMHLTWAAKRKARGCPNNRSRPQSYTKLLPIHPPEPQMRLAAMSLQDYHHTWLLCTAPAHSANHSEHQ